MITLDDVQDFGTSWFNAVATGASAAEQAQFFFHPHARINSFSTSPLFTACSRILRGSICDQIRSRSELAG
jgi:hypothetical protein